MSIDRENLSTHGNKVGILSVETLESFAKRFQTEHQPCALLLVPDTKEAWQEAVGKSVLGGLNFISREISESPNCNGLFACVFSEFPPDSDEIKTRALKNDSDIEKMVATSPLGRRFITICDSLLDVEKLASFFGRYRALYRRERENCPEPPHLDIVMIPEPLGKELLSRDHTLKEFLVGSVE